MARKTARNAMPPPRQPAKRFTNNSQTQNKTSSADQASTSSTVSPGSKPAKRLAEYLLDPCWDLESSGGTNMSETEISPASDVAPLQNRQRIYYEEGSIKGADLSDDLDFSPPPKAQLRPKIIQTRRLLVTYTPSANPLVVFLAQASYTTIALSLQVKPLSASSPAALTTMAQAGQDSSQRDTAISLDIYEPRQSSGYNINANFRASL